MRRRTFDLITSSVGVLLAVLLLVAGRPKRGIHLVLSILGFLHMRCTPAKAELQPAGV
jgi:hypothetical protein